MTEYALTVFAICAITGVLGLLSYGSGRAEQISLAVITLFIIVSPVVSAAGSFDMDNWLGALDTPDIDADSGYSQAIEESFAEGIVLLVADKFSLNKEDIRVKPHGFDPRNMRADNIKVILSGRAALADHKAIEVYLDRLDMGDFSVEINITKQLS